MVSSATHTPGIKLPILDDEQVIAVSTFETDQNVDTWSDFSREEKIHQLFCFALGFSCITGIPTAFFGTITAVLVKIEDEIPDDTKFPIYIVPAIATAIFGTLFFAAITSCCYGVGLKCSSENSDSEPITTKHSKLNELP